MEIHALTDERRPAFIGRLQHMQKLGFPAGINTGRGRAAQYSPHHVFLIGVALQLNETGLAPERSIATIETSLARLASGVQRALGVGGSPEAVLCEIPTGRMQDLVYGDNVSDYSGLSIVDRAHAEQMVDFLFGIDGPVLWSVFSLSGLVQRLGRLLNGEGDSAFEAGLIAWAETAIEASSVDT